MRVWGRAIVAGAAVVLATGTVQSAGAATNPPAQAGQADGAQPGDPALTVDAGAVERAMTCRGPLDGGGREPVLLVHGTFVTGGETYGWSYLPDLAARGYRVCTVELPNRAIDDIQVAAESVVVGVHRLARESGRRVELIGHSQGALEARWAVRWWPSVQRQVDDLVSLSGPNQGTTVAANPLTPLSGCAACLQMAPGSAFIRALNAGDQTPGKVSYTSVYSTLVDELITPNATAARIEGASNLELQALCPGRVVDHLSVLADAAAHALVLDAFGHAGPATAGRFDRATCRRATFVGLPGVAGGLGALLTPPSIPVVGAIPTVEPALKPYARADPAAPASTTTTARAASVSAPPGPAASASAASHRSSPAGPVKVDSAPATPVALHAEPATSTRHDTRSPAVPALAGLALALTAGAAGGVAARRRRASA